MVTVGNIHPADWLNSGYQGFTGVSVQDCHDMTGLQLDLATVIEPQDGRAAGTGDEAHAADDRVACSDGAARFAVRHGNEPLHVVHGSQSLFLSLLGEGGGDNERQHDCKKGLDGHAKILEKRMSAVTIRG